MSRFSAERSSNNIVLASPFKHINKSFLAILVPSFKLKITWTFLDSNISLMISIPAKIPSSLEIIWAVTVLSSSTTASDVISPKPSSSSSMYSIILSKKSPKF